MFAVAVSFQYAECLFVW